MKKLKREVQVTMKILRKLAQEIEKLEVSIKKLDTSRAKKTTVFKAAKKKSVKKANANIIVPRKLKKPTAFYKAIGIIVMSPKGISVDQIRKKTGYDAKKIANIVYKGKKRGMINAVSKGVYVKAGKTCYQIKLLELLPLKQKLQRQEELYRLNKKSFSDEYFKMKKYYSEEILKAQNIDLELSFSDGGHEDLKKKNQHELKKQKDRKASKSVVIKSKKKPQLSSAAQTKKSIAISEWTTCPVCGVSVKIKNLNKHLRKIHQKSITKSITKKIPIKKTFVDPIKTTDPKGACPGCGALYGCYCT